MVTCKKCSYFDKKIGELSSKSGIVVGFCRLRGKFITDQSMTRELCKDKAVVDMNSKDIENNNNQKERREQTVVTF